MKEFFKKLVHKSGYTVAKTSNEIIGIPVEASQFDRKLIREILAMSERGFISNDRRLSMVSIPRLWAVISASRYVIENDIPGDFVECGVWKGGCSIAMASVIREMGSDKKVYLYDTFAGMTEPGEFDTNLIGDEPRHEVHEKKSDSIVPVSYDYYNLGETECGIEDVKANFSKVDLLDVAVFVQGDVRKTLLETTLLPSTISLLRLDTDWFDTTRIEMEVLYPMLESGGVLLVDDYGSFDGARKAIEEYFAKFRPSPLPLVTDTTGRAYVKAWP